MCVALKTDTHAGRSAITHSTTMFFVGLDVYQESIAVAYASEQAGSEVVSLGTVGTRQCAIDKLVRQLLFRCPTMVLVYEAGPCG